jgi:hypothetical protein
MPWDVQKSGCPDDKPWAVVKSDTGAVVGCHTTEEGARAQQAALYANVKEGD